MSLRTRERLTTSYIDEFLESSVPTSGLSLVGFLGRTDAIAHLLQTCLPARGADNEAAAEAAWQTAQQNLGAAFPPLGAPPLTPLDQSKPHVQAVLASHLGPRISHELSLGASLQWAEIEPLLAFQLTVDLDRSHHHCAALSKPPTEDELLELCLPTAPSSDQLHVAQNGHSVLIRSRSLNFQVTAGGIIPPGVGIQLGWSLPIVHVVRFNGRCYLHNGFHRAAGARLAGATAVPCLFRDVTKWEEVGPSAFPQQLMESLNPPTVGHFTTARAHSVRLRAAARVIHVTWTDHIVLEE